MTIGTRTPCSATSAFKAANSSAVSAGSSCQGACPRCPQFVYRGHLVVRGVCEATNGFRAPLSHLYGSQHSGAGLRSPER